VSEHVAAGQMATLRAEWLTVVVVGAYVSVLAATEAVSAFVGAVPAAAIDGVVLVALLTHYLVSGGRVLAALALVPLLRLSSLAVSIEDPVAFYVLSGTPVLLAAVLAADALELPGVLALWQIGRRSQWHVALPALAVAGLASPLLGLQGVAHSRSAGSVALAAVVVFVFAGVLEELIFRGLLQASLGPLLGGWAVPVANGLFAATYLGSGSAPYTLFMAAFGMACGWWVRRTGSLAGAAIGHGLLAAGLLVLWPVVL
jgi:membrane protease YdiL (CAAX protease family)